MAPEFEREATGWEKFFGPLTAHGGVTIGFDHQPDIVKPDEAKKAHEELKKWLDKPENRKRKGKVYEVQSGTFGGTCRDLPTKY